MSYQARLPEGLRDITKSLTKEILREKPKNIYEFAAQYFEAQMPQSDKFSVSAYEEPGDYTTLLKMAGRHTQIPIALVYAIMPDRLIEFIKDFIKAVLKQNPRNICHFAVQYFRQMHRDRPLELSPSDYEEYERYLKSKGRYAYPIKCTCGRWLGRTSRVSEDVAQECQENERKHLGKMAVSETETVRHEKSKNLKEDCIKVREAHDKITELKKINAIKNVTNEIEKPNMVQEKADDPNVTPEETRQPKQLINDKIPLPDDENPLANKVNSKRNSHENYINAVHVIQRFLRKCLLRKKSLKNRTYSKPPEAMTDEMAALIIQRSLRKMFTTKKQQQRLVQPSTSGLLTDSLSQIDERSDISEATSYTSASTVLAGGADDKDIRIKDVDTLDALEENISNNTQNEDEKSTLRLIEEADSVEKSIDVIGANNHYAKEPKNSEIFKTENIEISTEKQNEKSETTNEKTPTISNDDTTSNIEDFIPQTSENEADKLAEDKDNEIIKLDETVKNEELVKVDHEENPVFNVKDTDQLHTSATKPEAEKPLPDFRVKYFGNPREQEEATTDQIDKLQIIGENDSEISPVANQIENDRVGEDRLKDQGNVITETEQRRSGQSATEVQAKNDEKPTDDNSAPTNEEIKNDPEKDVEETKMIVKKLVHNVAAVQSINNILNENIAEEKSSDLESLMDQDVENDPKDIESVDTNENELTAKTEELPEDKTKEELENKVVQKDTEKMADRASTENIKISPEIVEAMPRSVHDDDEKSAQNETQFSLDKQTSIDNTLVEGTSNSEQLDSKPNSQLDDEKSSENWKNNKAIDLKLLEDAQNSIEKCETLKEVEQQTTENLPKESKPKESTIKSNEDITDKDATDIAPKTPNQDENTTAEISNKEVGKDSNIENVNEEVRVISNEEQLDSKSNEGQGVEENPKESLIENDELSKTFDKEEAIKILENDKEIDIVEPHTEETSINTDNISARNNEREESVKETMDSKFTEEVSRNSTITIDGADEFEEIALQKTSAIDETKEDVEASDLDTKKENELNDKENLEKQLSDVESSGAEVVEDIIEKSIISVLGDDTLIEALAEEIIGNEDTKSEEKDEDEIDKALNEVKIIEADLNEKLETLEEEIKSSKDVQDDQQDSSKLEAQDVEDKIVEIVSKNEIDDVEEDSTASKVNMNETYIKDKEEPKSVDSNALEAQNLEENIQTVEPNVLKDQIDDLSVDQRKDEINEAALKAKEELKNIDSSSLEPPIIGNTENSQIIKSKVENNETDLKEKEDSKNLDTNSIENPTDESKNLNKNSKQISTKDIEEQLVIDNVKESDSTHTPGHSKETDTSAATATVQKKNTKDEDKQVSIEGIIDKDETEKTSDFNDLKVKKEETATELNPTATNTLEPLNSDVGDTETNTNKFKRSLGDEQKEVDSGKELTGEEPKMDSPTAIDEKTEHLKVNINNIEVSEKSGITSGELDEVSKSVDTTEAFQKEIVDTEDKTLKATQMDEENNNDTTFTKNMEKVMILKQTPEKDEGIRKMEPQKEEAINQEEETSTAPTPQTSMEIQGIANNEIGRQQPQTSTTTIPTTIGTQNSPPPNVSKVVCSDMSSNEKSTTLPTPLAHSSNKLSRPNPSSSIVDQKIYTDKYIGLPIAEIHLKSFKAVNALEAFPWFDASKDKTAGDGDVNTKETLVIGGQDGLDKKENVENVKENEVRNEQQLEMSKESQDNRIVNENNMDILEDNQTKQSSKKEENVEAIQIVSTDKETEGNVNANLATESPVKIPETERTATYLYGVHKPRESPGSMRKSYKPPTAFVIPIDGNSKRGISEASIQNAPLIKTTDVDAVSKDLEEEDSIDLETPTKLFAELSAFDYELENDGDELIKYSLDDTYRMDEIKLEHPLNVDNTSTDESDVLVVNDSNDNDQISHLSIIMELSECESPAPSANDPASARSYNADYWEQLYTLNEKRARNIHEPSKVYNNALENMRQQSEDVEDMASRQRKSKEKLNYFEEVQNIPHIVKACTTIQNSYRRYAKNKQKIVKDDSKSVTENAEVNTDFQDLTHLTAACSKIQRFYRDYLRKRKENVEVSQKPKLSEQNSADPLLMKEMDNLVDSLSAVSSNDLLQIKESPTKSVKVKNAQTIEDLKHFIEACVKIQRFYRRYVKNSPRSKTSNSGGPNAKKTLKASMKMDDLKEFVEACIKIQRFYRRHVKNKPRTMLISSNNSNKSIGSSEEVMEIIPTTLSTISVYIPNDLNDNVSNNPLPSVIDACVRIQRFYRRRLLYKSNEYSKKSDTSNSNNLVSQEEEPIDVVNLMSRLPSIPSNDPFEYEETTNGNSPNDIDNLDDMEHLVEACVKIQRFYKIYMKNKDAKNVDEIDKKKMESMSSIERNPMKDNSTEQNSLTSKNIDTILSNDNAKGMQDMAHLTEACVKIQRFYRQRLKEKREQDLGKNSPTSMKSSTTDAGNSHSKPDDDIRDIHDLAHLTEACVKIQRFYRQRLKNKNKQDSGKNSSTSMKSSTTEAGNIQSKSDDNIRDIHDLAQLTEACVKIQRFYRRRLKNKYKQDSGKNSPTSMKSSTIDAGNSHSKPDDDIRDIHDLAQLTEACVKIQRFYRQCLKKKREQDPSKNRPTSMKSSTTDAGNSHSKPNDDIRNIHDLAHLTEACVKIQRFYRQCLKKKRQQDPSKNSPTSMKSSKTDVDIIASKSAYNTKGIHDLAHLTEACVKIQRFYRQRLNRKRNKESQKNFTESIKSSESKIEFMEPHNLKGAMHDSHHLTEASVKIQRFYRRHLQNKNHTKCSQAKQISAPTTNLALTNTADTEIPTTATGTDTLHMDSDDVKPIDKLKYLSTCRKSPETADESHGRSLTESSFINTESEQSARPDDLRHLIEACIKIQRFYRRYTANRQNNDVPAAASGAAVSGSEERNLKFHKAAITIQKHFRAYMEGKQTAATINNRPANVENGDRNVQVLAAAIIQNAFREHMRRQRRRDKQLTSEDIATAQDEQLTRYGNVINDTVSTHDRISTNGNNLIAGTSDTSAATTTPTTSKVNWFVGNVPIVPTLDHIPNTTVPEDRQPVALLEYAESSSNSKNVVGSACNETPVKTSAQQSEIVVSANDTLPKDPQTHNSLNTLNALNNLEAQGQTIGKPIEDRISKEEMPEQEGQDEHGMERLKRETNQTNVESEITPVVVSTADVLMEFLQKEREHALPQPTGLVPKLVGEMLKSLANTAIPYEKLPQLQTEGNDSLSSADQQFSSITSSSNTDHDDTSQDSSLDTITEKLQKSQPDETIDRMAKRRASQTQIEGSVEHLMVGSIFEEPQIKALQDNEDEEQIVLQPLENEEQQRQSSADSANVVIGNADEGIGENFPTSPVYKGAFKRLHTIAGGDERSLLKSVTIDDTVQYIEPSAATSDSSFCLDDDTTAEIRHKMMAYSMSEGDSDYMGVRGSAMGISTDERIPSVGNDDFNISTALADTAGTSTDTESTIVSAATKIQAGARGFLARRRLQRFSGGTKSSCQTDAKASFGNAAIDESLERLVEDVAAKKIQTAYRKHYRRNLKVKARQAERDNTMDNSMENALAAKRLTLQRGDALRNYSTPDEETDTSDNGGAIGKTKMPTASSEPKAATSKPPRQRAATVKMASGLRWPTMRQYSMPVQIESEIFRVIPKHKRKRIRSAETGKKGD